MPGSPPPESDLFKVEYALTWGGWLQGRAPREPLPLPRAPRPRPHLAGPPPIMLTLSHMLLWTPPAQEQRCRLCVQGQELEEEWSSHEFPGGLFGAQGGCALLGLHRPVGAGAVVGPICPMK